MADDEKVQSTDKLLQALDALSQLNQARVTRRSNSHPLTRSAGSSSKDGSDAGAGGDAAVEEASRPRPRVSPRLSPTSPIWSKQPNKLVDKGDDGKEEDGDDSALIIIIKPRHRLSLMLPFQARSKLINKHNDDDFDDYDGYDDDDDHLALFESPDADGEKKGITYHGPFRVTSRMGMRRMSCLFSVEVVVVQGLPPDMNGLRLTVTVRRKETRDGAVRTMPTRVRLGVADFDEVLCVRCSLYGAGRPISFDPRPFVVSLVAVDAPEMDLGRSAVDLGMFAKEFTEKRARQWDMVFPLTGKAKGGELVVNLAIQSIDDDGNAEWYSQLANEDNMASFASLSSSFNMSSVSAGRKRRVGARKLRRSISNTMTTVNTTHAKTDVPAPDLLRGIDSLELDEPELELTPIDEVKETKQKKQECEPTDMPTPVPELEEEEEKLKEMECEATDESTSVTEVDEEELQTDSEQESTDEPTAMAEVKEEEQQKESECKPIDEPTPMTEVETEEQQTELEHEPANDPTTVTKAEEQLIEPTCEAADESTPVVQLQEEQLKDLEHGLEHDVIDKCDEGQEVKVDDEEGAEVKQGSKEDKDSFVANDEASKAMANGVEEKSFEATMPNGVANEVELMNGKNARPKEAIGESFQMPEQGKESKDKVKDVKTRQPRFKWRTVALLVPLAILSSKTLGARR